MTGIKLSTVAWRNLWRNRRRTLITLFGISFGVFLAIMFTGIGDATYGNMIDMAAKMGTGHVVVQHSEYLEAPSLQKSIKKTPAIVKQVEADDQVINSAVRISGQTMLATASGSYGAMFFAIDPDSENSKTLSLFEGKLVGENISTADDDGIVVGAKLLKNLDGELGSKIVFTMTDKHGEIVSALARVKGTIETGSDSLDSSLCIFGINNIRTLLNYEADEATQVALFIDDQRLSDKTARRLSESLGKGVVANSWKEVSPDLDGFITMKVFSTELFEYVIMILVIAGIFNTLLMSVLERVREFGIMSAIGFNPAKLFSLVMWESLYLAICGLLLSGVFLAWPYYYMNTKGLDFSQMVKGEKVEVAGVGMEMSIMADIHIENAIIIVVSALLATLLAGVYPAIKAGSVTPVENLKIV